jgi:hypothetical protein
MKKHLSILFITLFVASVIAPLIAFDTCDMPCCAVEIETCCQVEKQMDCNMEMANCDTRIIVVLPCAPLNKVNQEIIPSIQSLKSNTSIVFHNNIIRMLMNQGFNPEPPPTFNHPLLI